MKQFKIFDCETFTISFQLNQVLSIFFKLEENGIALNSSFEVRYTKLDGSPDMRFKENRIIWCKKGKNIDGSPDMRVKKNRQKKGLYANKKQNEPFNDE